MPPGSAPDPRRWRRARTGRGPVRDRALTGRARRRRAAAPGTGRVRPAWAGGRRIGLRPHGGPRPPGGCLALADPGARTQVLSRGPVTGAAGSRATEPARGRARSACGRRAAPGPAGQPTGRGRDRDVRRCRPDAASRSVASSCVAGPLGSPGVRWSFGGLTTVALLAAGLFVRLPWSRALSDERRRAVSALLTTGVAVATIGVGVAVGSVAGCAVGRSGQRDARAGRGRRDGRGQPGRPHARVRVGAARRPGLGDLGRGAARSGDVGHAGGPGLRVGRARDARGPGAGARPWSSAPCSRSSPPSGWPPVRGRGRPGPGSPWSRSSDSGRSCAAGPTTGWLSARGRRRPWPRRWPETWSGRPWHCSLGGLATMAVSWIALRSARRE